MAARVVRRSEDRRLVLQTDFHNENRSPAADLYDLVVLAAAEADVEWKLPRSLNSVAEIDICGIDSELLLKGAVRRAQPRHVSGTILIEEEIQIDEEIQIEDRLPCGETKNTAHLGPGKALREVAAVSALVAVVGEAELNRVSIEKIPWVISIKIALMLRGERTSGK